ncbi:MAG: class I SAM-dependent methyltransferase [Candidatus Pacebacteria bacterium]|nr:class I SAM-dependent methyltransferase [Candidatus Paceibacterota bacterium]
MKKNYNSFAKVYDEVVGKDYQMVYKKLIKKSLLKNTIKGKNILELGCGTGTILKSLSSNNKTFGIDISAEMIALAKEKDTKSEYLIMSMVDFKLPEFFDIIFCPFDSINHLLNIKNWEKTFKNVEKHLKSDGVFIFDFNTMEKFNKINNKIIKKNIKNGYVTMETKSFDNKCTWNISIYYNKEKGYHLLSREKITEASFPEDQILKILKKHFRKTKIIKKGKERIFVSVKK